MKAGRSSEAHTRADATPDSGPALTDPRETLSALDGWMSATGYGDDHPWRIAIADALQSARDDRVAAAGSLFSELALKADELATTLTVAIDSNEERLLPVARDSAQCMGCLADWAATACGAVPISDHEGRLLSPRGIDALTALRGVSA